MTDSSRIAIAIVCVDDRLHEDNADIRRQLKEMLGADRVFVRTTAGPDGKVLRQAGCYASLMDDIRLLIEKKGASIVALCGHYDCAGHTVPDSQHDMDVLAGVEILRAQLSQNGYAGEVVPLIAYESEGAALAWTLKALTNIPPREAVAA